MFVYADGARIHLMVPVRNDIVMILTAVSVFVQFIYEPQSLLLPDCRLTLKVDKQTETQEKTYVRKDNYHNRMH